MARCKMIILLRSLVEASPIRDAGLASHHIVGEAGMRFPHSCTPQDCTVFICAPLAPPVVATDEAAFQTAPNVTKDLP